MDTNRSNDKGCLMSREIGFLNDFRTEVLGFGNGQDFVIFLSTSGSTIRASFTPTIPEIVLQYQINLTLFSHEIKRMLHIAGKPASREDRLSGERPVESRTGAVAYSPVSHPRSSNRACGSAAPYVLQHIRLVMLRSYLCDVQFITA